MHPIELDKNEGHPIRNAPHLQYVDETLTDYTYFFSSTSTYSASITPSSFFGSSGAPLAAVAPLAVAEAAVALYIASASLWLTVVRRSLAEFSSLAPGVPASVDFASAKALSTSVLSDSATLSPASFNIFSTLYTSESS